jgi:hypothetical protein
MVSKTLMELTDEDAIELAEAATFDKGNYYFSGISNKGKTDEVWHIMKLDASKEFKIFPCQRVFDFVDLETFDSLIYHAIELVDKLRELDYELKENE